MATNFKIGESDLDYIVLYILLRHPNIGTTKLKEYIWQFTQPTGVNLAPLVDRNDTAIDQIVRNIISHRYESSNNIIYRGLVRYDGGILNITQKGLEKLDEYMTRRPFMQSAINMLSERCPGSLKINDIMRNRHIITGPGTFRVLIMYINICSSKLILPAREQELRL